MACIVGNRHGTGSARLVIAILCLIAIALAMPLGAQTPDGPDGVDSQSTVQLLTPVVMETTVNEVVELRLQVLSEGTDDLVLSLPELEEGLELDEAPIFVRRGSQQIEARLRIRPEAPGRYLLTGLGIRRGISTEVVDTILLEVADREGDVPFSLRWRVLVEEPRVGQSIPVVLEMVRIDEFAYPEAVEVRAPDQGLFEEVAGLGSVRSAEYGGVELFEVPVAGFLFTPAEVGRVEIPPAEVSAMGFSIRSTPGVFETEDLPSAVATTTAVGSFTMSVDLTTPRLDPGQSGRLSVTVRGKGNIPVLSFPVLRMEGLSIIEETEESTFTVDTNDLLGYEGSRTRTVRFEADGTTERSTIVVDPFPYFEPDTSQIGRVPGRTLEIATPIVETATEPVSIPEYALIEPVEFSRLRWYPLSAIPWAYLALIVPPFGLGVALILRAVRSGRSPLRLGSIALLVPFLLAFRFTPDLNYERLSRAHELADQGRPAVAGVLYDFELEGNPENAALHYNRGILALRAQDAARATFHLRRALRIVPDSPVFRSALDDTLRFFELPAVYPIPRYPRPVYSYLALLAFWTTFCIVLFVRGRTRRAIALLSLLFLQLIAAGGLIWSYQINRTPEATVLQEAILRRIPDPDAIPWVQLSPATVVMVELGYEEFYLIRTGNGVTGWIPVSAVAISVKERS